MSNMVFGLMQVCSELPGTREAVSQVLSSARADWISFKFVALLLFRLLIMWHKLALTLWFWYVSSFEPNFHSVYWWSISFSYSILLHILKDNLRVLSIMPELVCRNGRVTYIFFLIQTIMLKILANFLCVLWAACLVSAWAFLT